MPETIPEAVRNAWAEFADRIWQPVDSGLINKTYRVIDSNGLPTAIVQRLHQIFEGNINVDIDAITSHLSKKTIVTPRVIATDRSDLWMEDDGFVWRALTYVPGETYSKISSHKLAYQAGKLVGDFHLALNDLEHEYTSNFDNVHNTKAHLERLEVAVGEKSEHRFYRQVMPFVEQIFKNIEGLTEFLDLRRRHCHGDLKISNILFEKSGSAICLIDLDTLCRLAWPLEMGDALRSWCNPNTEDEPCAALNLEYFDAALRGYAEANETITQDEWQRLVTALMQICLELSARFFTDTLNETYFGWDANRYPSRGDHNLARGQSMWTLFKSVQQQRQQAEHIVRERFG